MLILSQRVLDTLFGTDFGWQSRNQLAKWISKSEHRIERGFEKVRAEGSGGKWKWFGICINYQLAIGRRNVQIETTKRPFWCVTALDSLGERGDSIKCRRLCFNLWQFSPRTCKSNPLPPHSLPFCLHSVVAASIAAAFWTKDSCKWLVKSQHSNAPRTGRGRPLPLRRHIDKKVQIKEGNGLQKGRNQSRAKQSEAKSLKIKQKSLLALGLDFYQFFPLCLSLSRSLCLFAVFYFSSFCCRCRSLL